MPQAIFCIQLFIMITFVVGWLLVAVISIREKELIAFRRSLFLGIITAFPFLFIVFLPVSFQMIWAKLILSTTIIMGVILVFPTRSKNRTHKAIPDDYRFDERNTMFSRAELQPDSKRYRDYYASHPQHKTTDERFRQNPGLL